MFDWRLALSVIVPNVGGIASAIGSSPSKESGSKQWYDSLNKSPLNPPNWLFGPAWTFLYTTMGVASYLVATDGGVLSDYFPSHKKVESTEMRNLLFFGYGLQLTLNFIWTPLFFKMRKMKYALFDMMALVGVVTALMIKYGKYNKYASYMMIPYILWGSFATHLTYYIYTHNDKSKFD